MGEQNYTLESDLKETQLMVEALLPYVYEEELYGRVGMNTPRLTLGSVLLRLHRLWALRGQMSASQAALVEQLVNQHENVRQSWESHYLKKLVQEAAARLRDIETYLGECKEDPKLCANAYMPEALRRTMIEEILTALPEAERQISGLEMKARQIDGGLRRYVRGSDFIWSSLLQPLYPAEAYWWLYSRPPQA